MQIVINHLTRMQKGYICVAGIDLATGLHIRPVLQRQIPTDYLAEHGGLFGLRRIIDLGDAKFVGKVPEIEDFLFDQDAARHVADMPEEDFRGLIEGVAKQRLISIFGHDLHQSGASCAVEETCGLRSLGCYWAEQGRLFIDEPPDHSRRRIRFSWRSGEFTFTSPVTDIRLFEDDHITPCEETVRRINDRVGQEDRVLLSVGLSRPYRPSNDQPSQHWLQINNIHVPWE